MKSKDELLEIFSRRLKKLREDNGISGKKMSEICGVSKVTEWQWENGECYPNNEKLLIIANYFNVSTDYILGKDESNRVSKDDLNDFEVAFYGEVKELSPEAKEKVVEYARFLKEQESKKKK